MAWDSQRPLYRFSRRVADDVYALHTILEEHQLGCVRVPGEKHTWSASVQEAFEILDSFARLMDDCTT
jgi:hypothetical protein